MASRRFSRTITGDVDMLHTVRTTISNRIAELRREITKNQKKRQDWDEKPETRSSETLPQPIHVETDWETATKHLSAFLAML